jgi:uncharacterized protein (TIGR02246 family)
MSATRVMWFALLGALPVATPATPSPGDDRATVAALDAAYQAAVKRNDADTMARILDEHFVLVVGNGQTYSREQLLEFTRAATYAYEQQDEEPGTQTVRMFGDTAIVTAKLWIRYRAGGRTVDRRLWFSDTYVRTDRGWRYAFGQASLPLPDAQANATPPTGRGANN